MQAGVVDEGLGLNVGMDVWAVGGLWHWLMWKDMWVRKWRDAERDAEEIVQQDGDGDDGDDGHGDE